MCTLAAGAGDQAEACEVMWAVKDGHLLERREDSGLHGYSQVRVGHSLGQRGVVQSLRSLSQHPAC